MPDLTKDEDGFTEMQRAFLEAYIGPARYNASEAARRAGYSERTAHAIGHELKNKPHIRTAIEEDMRELEKRTQRAIARRAGAEGEPRAP